MSDNLIHAAAQMSKSESRPACHNCDHWTPNGAKPLLNPSYGECEKGGKSHSSGCRTERDYSCIKHSALDGGGGDDE